MAEETEAHPNCRVIRSEAPILKPKVLWSPSDFVSEIAYAGILVTVLLLVYFVDNAVRGWTETLMLGAFFAITLWGAGTAIYKQFQGPVSKPTLSESEVNAPAMVIIKKLANHETRIEEEPFGSMFEAREFDLSWVLQGDGARKRIYLGCGFLLIVAAVVCIWTAGAAGIGSFAFIFLMSGCSVLFKSLLAVFLPIHMEIRPGRVRILEGTLNGRSFREVDAFDLSESIVQIDHEDRIVTLKATDDRAVSFGYRFVPDRDEFLTYLQAACGVTLSAESHEASSEVAAI